MDRGGWRVTKSRTQLRGFHFAFHTPRSQLSSRPSIPTSLLAPREGLLSLWICAIAYLIIIHEKHKSPFLNPFIYCILNCIYTVICCILDDRFLNLPIP